MAKGTETEHNLGRSTDNATNKWLDEQTELFTVSKLHTKICSFAVKDLNVYSLK